MGRTGAASTITHQEDLASFQVGILQKLQEFFRGVGGDDVQRLFQSLAIIEKKLANHRRAPRQNYSSSCREGQESSGFEHWVIGASGHWLISDVQRRLRARMGKTACTARSPIFPYASYLSRIVLRVGARSSLGATVESKTDLGGFHETRRQGGDRDRRRAGHWPGLR